MLGEYSTALMRQKKSIKATKKEPLSTTSWKDFKIYTTEDFLKTARELKKKYPNIKNDFFRLSEKLKKDPITGSDHVVGDIYKIRMRISDKNKGERDGARVIIEIKFADGIVYVLYAYDKSEISDISDKVLNALVRNAITTRHVIKRETSNN